MVWVGHLIGTGYSIGTPKATTQEEIAQNFVDFFGNWEKLFGIKNFEIYVTGESYTSRYVPYISAAMLDQNGKEYFDQSGVLVFDPCIGRFDYVQEEVSAVPFVGTNANLFNFNESFMAEIQALHQSCGHIDLPTKRNQPPVFFDYTSEANYDFDLINEAPSTLTPASTSTKSPRCVPCRGTSSVSPPNSSTRPQMLTSTSTGPMLKPPSTRRNTWTGPYLDGYDGSQGIMGMQHYERGPMWAKTYIVGHIHPQSQLRVTYKYIQWVLGRVNSL